MGDSFSGPPELWKPPSTCDTKNNALKQEPNYNYKKTNFWETNFWELSSPGGGL